MQIDYRLSSWEPNIWEYNLNLIETPQSQRQLRVSIIRVWSPIDSLELVWSTQ